MLVSSLRPSPIATGSLLGRSAPTSERRSVAGRAVLPDGDATTTAVTRWHAGRVFRSIRRAAAVAILALGVAVVGAAPASAHGQLAESTPADGSSTDDVVKELRLYFTESPNPAATFVVTAPDGTEVQRGWKPGESKRLSKPVQEFFLEDGLWTPVFYDVGYAAVVPLTHLPAAGAYTASYRSVASDGDEVTGELTFTYRGDPTRPALGDQPSPGGAADPSAEFAPVVVPTGSTQSPAAPEGSETPLAQTERSADDSGLVSPLLVGTGLALLLAACVGLRVLVRRSKRPPADAARR